VRAVQHSSETVEHYSPPDYMALVHRTMGGIDLDPASCEKANTIVKASRYYSENGLEQPWNGRVYLNPPGGSLEVKIGNARGKVNSQAHWWATLVDRFTKGMLEEAIFMCFNLELLRYAQRYAVMHPLDFPHCVPKDRIPFLNSELQVQKSPGHPNMVVYLGCNVDAFVSAFVEKGRVFR